MKIIHTADLHLGSPLGGAIPAEKIPERRNELLGTFIRLCDYADANGYELVLLAGDVFDGDLPPRDDKEFFYSAIKKHPNVKFLYLKGNHDSMTSYTESIPNLLTFGSEWSCYRVGDVCVYGIELPESNKRAAAETLVCNPDDINIVMLHGQIGGSSDDIVVKDYAGKGIDYMALGHVHGYTYGDIDARGKYVYSGCLEGRGFDEAGQKGFVEIDTDLGVGHRFRPFASRNIHICEVDVSDVSDKPDALAKGIAATASFPKDDIVRIVFKGEVSFDTAGLALSAQTYLKNSFYHVTVKDLTKTKPDIESIAKEESLAGEFVRLAAEADFPEGCDRGRVLTIGLKALYGELSEYRKER